MLRLLHLYFRVLCLTGLFVDFMIISLPISSHFITQWWYVIWNYYDWCSSYAYALLEWIKWINRISTWRVCLKICFSRFILDLTWKENERLPRWKLFPSIFLLIKFFWPLEPANWEKCEVSYTFHVNVIENCEVLSNYKYSYSSRWFVLNSLSWRRYEWSFIRLLTHS